MRRDTYAIPDLYDRIWEPGPRLLDHGSVPGPPQQPWQRDAPYPLAVDVDGRLGAVSFAVLDMYPDIAPGWCDWHTNGGAGHWDDEDEDRWRHTFFGIAPAGQPA